MEILDYRTAAKQLRQSANTVKQSDLTPEFLEKLASMQEILKKDGVGLAAPQVGWDVRLFMLSINEIGDSAPVSIFINPKILSSSKKIEKDIEGCLSFPGLYLDVNRPYSIEWEFTDLEWHTHKQKAFGFTARAIQHEVDHCNGRVFIDHVTSVQRLKVNKWLKG